LSFGGPVIGKYLGGPPHKVPVAHRVKVAAGAIFLASTFGAGPAQAFPTWPLGLINQSDAMANFNLAGPTCAPGDGCKLGCTPADPDCTNGLTSCPGQQDSGIRDTDDCAV